MTSQIEKELTHLVLKLFSNHDDIIMKTVKDFCLQHFDQKLEALKRKMIYSKSLHYEKEILVVNDDIEVMVSGWLPGNTCYPHDHDQAECFVFVLQGKVENTLLNFENVSLEVIDKTTKTGGNHLYLANGIIHYMQNTGNENLICLHVYTPGISEMKVFDDPGKTVFTLCGEASAWLPAKQDQILQVKSYARAAAEEFKKNIAVI